MDNLEVIRNSIAADQLIFTQIKSRGSRATGAEENPQGETCSCRLHKQGRDNWWW